MADEEASAEQRAADGAEDIRQVIANANISLVVADTAAALAGVEQVVLDLGRVRGRHGSVQGEV